MAVLEELCGPAPLALWLHELVSQRPKHPREHLPWLPWVRKRLLQFRAQLLPAQCTQLSCTALPPVGCEPHYTPPRDRCLLYQWGLFSSVCVPDLLELLPWNRTRSATIISAPTVRQLPPCNPPQCRYLFVQHLHTRQVASHHVHENCKVEPDAD